MVLFDPCHRLLAPAGRQTAVSILLNIHPTPFTLISCRDMAAKEFLCLKKRVSTLKALSRKPVQPVQAHGLFTPTV